MKIAVVGGGPSGLYLALLVKRANPEASLTVYEQNRADDTFGFGVVMADTGLSHLERADKASHDALRAAMRFSDQQTIRLNDEQLVIKRPGAGGGAITRLDLLEILQAQCREAGVDLRFSARVDPRDPDFAAVLDAADLVVGADGVNSQIRALHAAEFGATHRLLSNRFAWYGTRKIFASPALVFRAFDGGHFVAHYYPYSATMSTFVAECDEATWFRCGLHKMTDDERQALYERIYAAELDGEPLVASKSIWRQFPVVRNERWSVGKTVLVGDALSSAHFSIGSGTRIAMEDSIALADAIHAHPSDVGAALGAYETARRPGKTRLIEASENSFNWYERMADAMAAGNVQEFVYGYMTRTGRIDDARLREQFPELASALDAHWRGQAVSP